MSCRTESIRAGSNDDNFLGLYSPLGRHTGGDHYGRFEQGILLDYE